MELDFTAVLAETNVGVKKTVWHEIDFSHNKTNNFNPFICALGKKYKHASTHLTLAAVSRHNKGLHVTLRSMFQPCSKKNHREGKRRLKILLIWLLFHLGMGTETNRIVMYIIHVNDSLKTL